MAGRGRTRNDASMIPDEKAIETIKSEKEPLSAWENTCPGTGSFCP